MYLYDSFSSLHTQTKPDCISNDPVKLIPSEKQGDVYRFGDRSKKMIWSRETPACKHDEGAPSGLRQCLTASSVNLLRDTHVQASWCCFKEKGGKKFLLNWEDLPVVNKQDVEIFF